MKKTEKIEVRLSHEEKTALANLAEQEGRNVSELVRGLIERYMTLSNTRLPVKTVWPKLATIALGGLLLGHLGTYFMVLSYNHPDIYSLDANIYGHSLTVPVIAEKGMQTEFMIPALDGDIIIDTNIIRDNAALATVRFDICQRLGSVCKPIANPVLTFNPNESAAVQIETDPGKAIFLRLTPSRPNVEKI